MHIQKLILLIIAGLVALVLVTAALLPESLKVESETDIGLPVNKVYYSLVTFSGRSGWDPWVINDTTSRVTIIPAEGFVGSKYSWTSKNSGAGEMVIDSVVKDRHISLTLRFARMNHISRVWYDFSGKEGISHVKWSFSHDATYPVGRIILSMMKSRLQADYDQGLANLKKLLEEKGVQMSSLSEIQSREVPAFSAIVTEGKCALPEMSAKMKGMFESLAKSIQLQGLEITGAPFTHYISFDTLTGISVFELGYPVNKAGKSKHGTKAVSYPAFSALEAVHTGSYSELNESYSKFIKYITDKKVSVEMGSWEFYITGTMKAEDETNWKALIAFPMKR